MVMANAKPIPPTRKNRTCSTMLIRYKGFDSSPDKILERRNKTAPVEDAMTGTAAWVWEMYGKGIRSKRRVDIAGKKTKTNPPKMDNPRTPKCGSLTSN